jgi:DNA segregation ATPase FtsK/SpoIIIE-like protein
METHEYIERNTKTFIDAADKKKVFGCSYVQRLCRIGYNQAQHTIEEMLNREIINTEGDYTFSFVRQISPHLRPSSRAFLLVV